MRSGGVIKIGKCVVMNIALKALTTHTGDPTVILLPNGYQMKQRTPVCCIENSEGNFSTQIGTSITAGGESGNIYVKSITTNKYYFLSGIWFTD